MIERYNIVRHFLKSGRKFIIKSNLSLDEAKRHCSDPDMSSRTCTCKEGRMRTRRSGMWFDGFTRQ